MLIPISAPTFARPIYLGSLGETPTAELSKNGAAFAAGAGAVVELAGGWYVYNGVYPDNDTLGSLAYLFDAGNQDPSFVDDVVQNIPGGAVQGVTGNVDGNVNGDLLGNVSAGVADNIALALLTFVNGIEPGFTPQEALRIILAVLAGKLAIVGNTVTIRDVNDTVDRVVATTDTNGQRTGVAYDVS